MNNSINTQSTRLPVYTDYYTNLDLLDITVDLPNIVKQAELKAAQVLEPTINEKNEVLNIIIQFIKQKNRIVYGGTALNKLLIDVEPADAIYDENHFSDVEFYSPTPVPDMTELCNLLYERGYKFVQGREANHEETYTVTANLATYCDITYVATRVYNGIKTIEIDDIHYVHPHFMYIDYLRMFNDPLNAAWRWEKAFKRAYLLLKDYPLEYFNKPIKIAKPVNEIQTMINKLKSEFMMNSDVQHTCLITGFDAYNFFIKHAANDRNVDQMARIEFNKTNLQHYLVNIPYMEFVSVDYRNTVTSMYNYIRSIAQQKNLVTIDEYFPLFQFSGYSCVINYNGVAVAKIFDANGSCVPNIKTTRGYMYVSYQYLLMYLFINKFRSHLDKNKEMYFNYNFAISQLINARNIYLNTNNLKVINNTIFGEFKISCIGVTQSYNRAAIIRRLDKKRRGKYSFTYTPQDFFKGSVESQAKFDPSKYLFKNTSGNKIMNPKNLLFIQNENGDIIEKIYDIENDYTYDSDEQSDIDVKTNNTEKSNDKYDDKSNDKYNDKSNDKSNDKYDDKFDDTADSQNSTTNFNENSNTNNNEIKY